MPCDSIGVPVHGIAAPSYFNDSAVTGEVYIEVEQPSVSGCRLQIMVLTRRMFVAGAAGTGFALLGRSHGMSIHLSCGALGIKASQTEAIDYAAHYGFDVVDADGRYLADLSPSDLARLLDTMRSKNVGWAMAGFPTEFRKDDAAFAESVKTLPAFAAGVERAGVKRVTTWISPMVLMASFGSRDLR